MIKCKFSALGDFNLHLNVLNDIETYFRMTVSHLMTACFFLFWREMCFWLLGNCRIKKINSIHSNCSRLAVDNNNCLHKNYFPLLFTISIDLLAIKSVLLSTNCR